MLTGKLFHRGRLDRYQCLLGSSSAEEGWTDTNAHWDALLLRMAGQAPSSSTTEGWTDTNAHWVALKAGQTQCLLENTLNPLAWEGVTP